MTKPLAPRLIVGLGNPGPRYENTRHNAGVWFIETLAHHYRTSFREEKKFNGVIGKFTENNRDIFLLFPTTYMNNSGLSVSAFCHFYKIPSQAVLVAHDELDLDPGIARIKFAGGHGGHNGLRSIIDHLHSPNFLRLRIGVGKADKNNSNTSDYVLSAPKKSEQVQIAHAIFAAFAVFPLLLNEEIDKAMQQLHTKGNEDGI